MTVLECPGERLLTDYLAGRLDGPTHEAVDEHLDACRACQLTADGMEAAAGSSFPGLTPAPCPEPTTDGEFAQLVARVKALPVGAPTADPPLGEGAVLGDRYVILGLLGSGGMGCVYKARHKLMNRLVAIKVMAPELVRLADARARFWREALASGRLWHPNTVRILDTCVADGRHLLVMEYVEGLNLSDFVKRDGPLPVGMALGFIAQAARGLAHAHAAGVVHRDVKPANLLVDAAGVVKVLDLGLARLAPSDAEGGDPALTAAGAVMGTADYMAPEQAADTHRADERSDVYSLGCCLYFLLTGRPPYDGRTSMEVLFAHREQPIPNLRKERRDCPKAVDALFRAMVAKRPEDRPASMTAVLARLDALSRARPSLHGRWPWFAGAGALAAGVLAALTFLRVGGAAAVAPKPSADSPPAAADHAEPKPLSVDTVRVEAGDFLRGSPESDRDALDDEKPKKKISITRPFFLAKTKVTQELFQRVTGKNPSIFAPNGASKDKLRDKDTSDYPVDSVRWIEAIEFCNRLSERDGLPPYYRIENGATSVSGGDGWRLPTEAEWEYAARAGTETRWSFGDDAADLGDYAWFAGNSGGTTHPVGRKKPNPWGLYDTYGDVPEWCWDRYSRDYYKRSPLSDPAGAGDGDARVYRGGAWNDAADQTRSATRQDLGTAYGGVLNHVGFRVARNAAP